MNGTKIQQLLSAEDYFSNVLNPNKTAFFGHEPSFDRILNLASSLFHFHEWMFNDHQSSLEQHASQKFTSKGPFWQWIESQCPNAAYIRDVANASKHVTIGNGSHKTSTGMSHIANTHIVSSGFGMGAYGAGRYGGTNAIMEDSGSQISFDLCAKEVFNFWHSLLQTVTGKSIPT